MNTYKIPWFCVIQPYLLESTRPIPSPYIIPIMKSPVKLMVFLLYLILFNRTDDPRIEFAYLLPIIQVKVIFFYLIPRIIDGLFQNCIFCATLIQDKTITYIFSLLSKIILIISLALQSQIFINRKSKNYILEI